MRKLLAPLLYLILISGCSSELKKSLGITKSEPDEYAVLKRPPLSVPPGFELQPPHDDSKNTKSLSEVNKSKKYKINFSKNEVSLKNSQDKDSQTELNRSERKFLEKNNVKSNPSIREVLEKENQESKKKSKSKSIMDVFKSKK